MTNIKQKAREFVAMSDLFYELDGVITDVERGNGFDDVCLRTLKRVRDALQQREPEYDLWRRVVRYIYGDIAPEVWERVVSDKLTPPLPLPEHAVKATTPSPGGQS